MQVLQVGVEQVAPGQRNPQNPLDDVTNGAVVGESDLLRRVHEVTATGKIEGYWGSERRHFKTDSRVVVVVVGGVLTWPTGSSSGPDPGSHRSPLPRWQTRSSLVSVETRKGKPG